MGARGGPLSTPAATLMVEAERVVPQRDGASGFERSTEHQALKIAKNPLSPDVRAVTDLVTQRGWI
jgi:hypothetical protein